MKDVLCIDLIEMFVHKHTVFSVEQMSSFEGNPYRFVQVRHYTHILQKIEWHLEHDTNTTEHA